MEALLIKGVYQWRALQNKNHYRRVRGQIRLFIVKNSGCQRARRWVGSGLRITLKGALMLSRKEANHMRHPTRAHEVCEHSPRAALSHLTTIKLWYVLTLRSLAKKNRHRKHAIEFTCVSNSAIYLTIKISHHFLSYSLLSLQSFCEHIREYVNTFLMRQL